MRKIILYAIVCLLLAVSASAYSTIISIGVLDMSCSSCASPTALTGMTGTGGIAAVATSAANCNSGSGLLGSNSIGVTISEGTTYSTGTASLTSGTTYYACLRLTELSMANAATPYLSGCTNYGSTTTKFTLSGTTCNGLSNACIPNPTCGATAETISFPFAFIA